MLIEDRRDPDDMMNGSYGAGFWMMVIIGLLLAALLVTTRFPCSRARTRPARANLLGLTM